MSSIASLLTWAQTSKGNGHHPYLLIDSAQAENSYLQLEKWHIAYASLFEGKPEAAIPEIAPLLIPLRDLDSDKLEKVCAWALDLGFSTPCFSWIKSSLNTSDLSEHLRNFHTVALSDDQHMMLRWYDTRILPVWFACLMQEQADVFTGGMLDLHYFNRFGDTVTLFSTDEPRPHLPPHPLGKPAISLTDAQYSVLVDASELDTLIAHVRRIITDETNKLPRQILVKFVSKYQQRAIAAGIGDLDRQTQYVLLALFTSGKGIEHPAAIALMTAPPTSLNDFYAAMQALPSDAWDGPALWDTADVTLESH